MHESLLSNVIATCSGQASNRVRLGYEINQSVTGKAWGRAVGNDGAVTCCGETSALSSSACRACSSVFGRVFNLGNLEVRTVQFVNYNTNCRERNWTLKTSSSRKFSAVN